MPYPPLALSKEREKTIYIAGPMTGYPEFNFPAFFAAEENLKSEGWKVRNPAAHGIVPEATYFDYLRWDVARLMECDTLYLLRGWETSTGAQLELYLAQRLTMTIMYQDSEEATVGSINSFSGPHEFLSNFHLCTMEYEGIIYPSSEHAYQASKTLYPSYRSWFTFRGVTPGQAKRMGPKVPLRPDWEQIKDHSMLSILRVKFADPELRRRLLGTGRAELIEGNRHGDTYWGVYEGKGLNKLGIILMQVRSEIQQEKA